MDVKVKDVKVKVLVCILNAHLFSHIFYSLFKVDLTTKLYE